MTQHKVTADVAKAVDVLSSGGIVGMPTETVYGLAAFALDENAVARVFAVKGRPTNHPLIVHLSPDADVSQWGEFTEEARALADAFWPGPLTLLVRRTSLVPDWVTGGRDTVALRVPSHPVAIQLLRAVNTGLVAPSANKFGKVSPTTAEHVMDDLGDDVDVILDGGACVVGVESTIVECLPQSVAVLRPGTITSDEIESVLRSVVGFSSGESRAPGMLLSHYSPDADVFLVETLEEGLLKRQQLKNDGRSVHFINFADVDEYARHLYQELRQADIAHCDAVVAVMPAASGVGIAVRDRLTKAATR
jgi:L-threonylcarbamoyladenylate synthase